MEFRKYENGDEQSILKLFKRTFGKCMSYDYWKWRYLDNPSIKENMINLAWDGDILAAHYAVSPVHLYINGLQYNAALSMTTMTDPDYQRQGLFVKLADSLFHDSETLDIIFGVPNNNSVKGFVNKLDFKLIAEIPMLQVKISNSEYKKSNRCVVMKAFDEKFDKLFESVKEKYKIITSRNMEHLNWRFISNRENEYTIFAYLENGQLLGYIVTKIYKGDEVPIGDIVDTLVTNELVLMELLSCACNLFKHQNVSLVNIWFTDNRLLNVIKDFGFTEIGQFFHFIVRDNRNDKSEEVFDFNNWYITMSDIDLF